MENQIKNLSGDCRCDGSAVGEDVKYKFINWSKFQIRNDYKHPWWFACKNDFFINPNFFDFSLEERLTFIYLLCIASQQAKNGEFFVDEKVFSRMTSMKSSHLFSTLEKLEQKQVVVGICTESVRNPTESVLTEHNKTKQNTKKRDDESSLGELAFKGDFDALYRKYPKKQGGSIGIARLKKIIKSQKDYDDFSLAIDNYISIIQKEKTELKFIKQFSSFVGTTSGGEPWRDYINIESLIKKPKPLKTLKDME